MYLIAWDRVFFSSWICLLPESMYIFIIVYYLVTCWMKKYIWKYLNKYFQPVSCPDVLFFSYCKSQSVIIHSSGYHPASDSFIINYSMPYFTWQEPFSFCYKNVDSRDLCYSKILNIQYIFDCFPLEVEHRNVLILQGRLTGK